ncbi:hypothetical protein HOY80DRAFT_226334 [Tuber brumale]|nr:hypothetical protein HOY80DRAFT_226334 [Tuber brumale]
MAEKAFYTILKAIKSGEPESLEFADLAPADSTQIIESLSVHTGHLEEHRFRVHFSAPDHHLRVVMPSYLHESAASWLGRQFAQWLAHGLFSEEAADAILMPPSPRVDNFTGVYASSVKEPDYAFVPIHPDGSRRDFPSVVLESGWASTAPDLARDRRLWHEGSGGRVMVVILVKLYRANAENQVCATLEISHTAPGDAIIVTRMNVFPIPNPIPPDPTLTLGELFGGQCLEGHDPQTVLPLEVGRLRRVLQTSFISDGYLAA